MFNGNVAPLLLEFQRMAKDDKLLRRILEGRSDANISFQQLRRILTSMGFQERIRGSHHIFVRGDVKELVNLQRDGSKAKPYQVKQVRLMISHYGLGSED